MGDTVSFDECVEERNADCDPKKLWMQIPWFCGNFRKVPTCFPKKYTKVIFTFYFQSVGSLATAGRWSRPSTTWSTSTSWWGSRRSWRHSFRCWRSRYQSEHDSQKNKINCFNSNPPPRFFRGASRMFAESEQFRHIRRTKHKDTPSDKTVQVCGKSKHIFQRFKF